MSKPKSINDCRTAADFDRVISRSGLDYSERQNGTSHRVYRFTDSGRSVPIPQHNGEIPTGTRHSIAKMLAMIGLAVVFPFILCNASTFLAQATVLA